VADKLLEQVAPAEIRSVRGESADLPAGRPDRWIDGYHPGRISVSGVTAPGAIEPASIALRRDGRPLQRGRDYDVDDLWGSIGGLDAAGPARLDYRWSPLRIDAIVRGEGGERRVVRGRSRLTCPRPPAIPVGAEVEAHVLVPRFAAGPDDLEVYAVPQSQPARAASPRLADRWGPELTITCWGDSVTAGGDASRPERAFPAVVPRLLQRANPRLTITGHAVAVGGSSSRDWLVTGRPGCEFDRVVATKPDILVVEFVNDAGLPPEQWPGLYGTIVERASELGARLVITTPHWTMREWMQFSDQGVDDRPYVHFLHEFCARTGTALADVSDRWRQLAGQGLPYETLLVNGINHPDDRGHRLAADAIIETVAGL